MRADKPRKRRADKRRPKAEACCYTRAGGEGGQLAYEFARYLKVRGAWGAGWSPDGRKVSFLTEITGVPQVWEMAAEGPSWPEQLTFYEERVSYAAYSPTEDEMLFGMDAGGNERSQLFLLRDGGVTDLTRAPDAIHYPGGFSPDGRSIAYTATRRNGTDFDVFVQDPTGGEPETVWEVSGYHTVAGWAPDGRALIVSRHHSNVDNDLYLLDLASGEARLLTPHEGDARFSGRERDPGWQERLPGDGPRRGVPAPRPARPRSVGSRLPHPGRLGRRGRRAFQGRPVPRRKPQRGRLLGRSALQRQGTQDA